MIAARQDQVGCILKLIEVGANVNNAKLLNPSLWARNCQLTALMLACLNGHTNCVSKLIENDADITPTDERG